MVHIEKNNEYLLGNGFGSNLSGTDEKNIKQLLLGCQKDRKDAIIAINSLYKGLIWGKIKQVGRYLSSHDIDDIYQEVLLSLLSVSEKKGFSKAKNILPYILNIARNKTVDRLRKIIRDQDFIAEFIEEKSNTKSNIKVHGLEADENFSFMFNEIMIAVAKMPSRQRQIAKTIIDHKDRRLTNKQICEIININDREKLSEQAVKRARQEVQKKITTAIQRKKPESIKYA